MAPVSSQTMTHNPSNALQVIIAIHHLPGQSDFLTRYSAWYNDVVTAYRDVIALHVAGHTHNDQFAIVSAYDKNNLTVLNQSMMEIL